MIYHFEDYFLAKYLFSTFFIFFVFNRSLILGIKVCHLTPIFFPSSFMVIPSDAWEIRDCKFFSFTEEEVGFFFLTFVFGESGSDIGPGKISAATTKGSCSKAKVGRLREVFEVMGI